MTYKTENKTKVNIKVLLNMINYNTSLFNGDLQLIYSIMFRFIIHAYYPINVFLLEDLTPILWQPWSNVR